MAGVWAAKLLVSVENGFRKQNSGVFINLRESCRQGLVLTIYQGRIDPRRSRKVMGVLRTTKKHVKN